jgi:hypothetical protein
MVTVLRLATDPITKAAIKNPAIIWNEGCEFSKFLWF